MVRLMAASGPFFGDSGEGWVPHVRSARPARRFGTGLDLDTCVSLVSCFCQLPGRPRGFRRLPSVLPSELVLGIGSHGGFGIVLLKDWEQGAYPGCHFSGLSITCIGMTVGTQRWRLVIYLIRLLGCMQRCVTRCLMSDYAPYLVVYQDHRLTRKAAAHVHGHEQDC